MNDKELVWENTPLENLRTILSEADASAKIAAPAVNLQHEIEGKISKTALKSVIERLQGEPQQFMSQAFISQTLAAAMGLGGRQEAVFDNKYVIRLERLLNSNI